MLRAMRLVLRLLLVTAASIPVAPAQTARFRDPVFATTVSTANLAYGAAINRWTTVVETLRLDLIEPSGDVASARPTLVLVHGGGFYSGDKADSGIRNIGLDLARRGYLVASINYRMQPQSAPVTLQTVTDAKEDVKAAIRFCRRFATTLRADPERIAVLGGSAGAMSCLEAAYVAGEGTSGNPGFASNVRAIVDLWGLLWDPLTMEAGEAPVCVVHGTNDTTIPYSYGQTIVARAMQVGVPFEFVTLQNVGHAAYSLWPSFSAPVVAFLWQHLRLDQVAGLAARAGATSPGTLTFDVFGLASDTCVLGLAAASANLPLEPWGTLGLDPASLFVLPAFVLPTSPRIATGSVPLGVPAGLGGHTIFAQVFAVRGSEVHGLSNAVSVAF